MSLLVAPCSYQAARYAVGNWHYSRSMPAPPLACFGVWEHERYIGAVIFGRGGNRNQFVCYGLDTVQGAELVRIALREHEAPVSQIVTQAVKRLKVSSPGLRLIVSFADPAHGHHGGIYQAMSWIYTGTSSPKREFIDADGRLYHTRVTMTSGWVRQFGKMTRVPKRGDLTPVQLPGKHRYLLPLDRAMRRQVERLARPYPRGQSVDGDAPAVLAGGVGSTPADRSDNNGLGFALAAIEGNT